MATRIPISTIITVDNSTPAKNAVIENTTNIINSDDPVLVSEIENISILKLTNLLETELAEEITDENQVAELETSNESLTKKTVLPPRNLTVSAVTDKDDKKSIITQTINNSVIQSRKENASVFPGGTQFSIQYNKNNIFTGSANLIFDSLTAKLDIDGNTQANIITTANISNPSGNIIFANSSITFEEDYFKNTNYSFPNTGGTEGQIFTTNGAGTISWATPESTFQNSITLENSTGIINHDCSLSYIFIHDNISDDFFINLINLNLVSGKSINVLVLLNQGPVAYYVPGLQIDGVLQSIKWVNGDLPFGTALKTDLYSFTILNNSSVYTVLGQMISFG